MFYKKIKYPDGSFYVTVNEFVKEFTFRINSYEDLWELNQIRDVYKHNGKNAIITIPSLFEAQADRRFHDEEPAGLKLLCNFLNSMGWEQIKIFHPHNSEVVESLMNNVKIIDNSDFIRNIIYSFDDLYGDEEKTHQNLILLSTDAGGFKPLMKLCDKINWQGETFSASKSRQYIEGKSKLTQIIDREDFGGKDILIIDDICVNGGTFIGLANMLRKRNCGKLYLAVSHMSLSMINEDLIKSFDKIFTTNSKGYDYLVEGSGHDKIGYKPDNLEIINLF